MIRDVTETDEAAWRRLWADYNAFYEAEVPAEVTEGTWRRLLDPSAPLFGRVAEWNGEVVGFTVCVLHAGTWTLAPNCYLEDLFVDPTVRGNGIGQALMQDLVERCRTNGWSRLYWHTRETNATARHLYDKFIAADDFVRYRIFIE